MKRRTLAELHERAEAELRTNPTITVYTFDGGVERRRAADPWAGWRAAMNQFVDAIAAVTIRFDGFSNALEAALAPAARRGYNHLDHLELQ